MLGAVAERIAGGRPGALLRGDRLGHALHPRMTDFPLGCWLSAGLLDLVGGRGGLAFVTGYLGGHLSFARRVGTGERGTAS